MGAASGTGTYTRLAEVGIGFTRTGELKLDKARLNDALTNDPAALASLFGDSSTGVFGTVSTVIDAPAELVYDLVADMPRMGEWSRECSTVEWIEGATGPAVGARFVDPGLEARRRTIDDAWRQIIRHA